MTAVAALLAGILAITGAPLFAVIAAIALVSFHGAGIDLSAVLIEMSRLIDTPLLVSLPLFIFAGTLLAESGTPGRILAVSRLLFGWLPGGLAVISLMVSAVFTAFTGASGVTIVALGGLLYPALRADRYEERFTLGLLTTSGSLGLLFAPSLPLILYGVISGARIDKLFLAGILPGLLMLLLLAGYCILRGRPQKITKLPTGRDTTETKEKIIITDHEMRGEDTLQNIVTNHAMRGEQLKKTQRAVSDKSSGNTWGEILKEAKWELPLPFIVLGGIYSGILVVGEAAAVTALYALIVQVMVYQDIPFRRVPSIMVKSMALFGGIFVVLAASLAFTSFLIDQQVPDRLFHFLSGHISSKYSFLLLLNLFLLAVGAMLDIFSALVLVVPLIIPLAQAYGVDLVHLGIIFLTNLQIGYCTPPVGLNLFLASYRFDQPITVLYRATLPFLLLLLITLLMVTFLPALSLLLPGV